MDKGIRPYCNAKFVELNNLRNRGELTNTQFRKSVIADVMDNFGITLASAATHYNHAFKTVKELNAELVSGLGRAEDKKGGRKPKAKVDVAPAGRDAVMANMMAALAGNTEQPPAAPIEGTLLSEGIKENTSTHTVTINPPAEPEVKTYTVTRVKDGTVIATGLLLSDAEALVAKAAAAKKAKLAFA